MAMCPVQYALQEQDALAMYPAKTIHQGRRFLARKVAKLDPASDVERGLSRVPNQVRRGGDAEQAEGQTIEFALACSRVVAFADGGEEFVAGKWQAADGVNFIDKHDDASGTLR